MSKMLEYNLLTSVHWYGIIRALYKNHNSFTCLWSLDRNTASVMQWAVKILRLLKPSFIIYYHSMIMQQVTFRFACTLKRCKVLYWSSEISVEFIQNLILVSLFPKPCTVFPHFPTSCKMLYVVYIYCCMMHAKWKYVQWQIGGGGCYL